MIATRRDAVAKAAQTCPTELAMAVLGGAWKLSTIRYLLEGAHRFGALQRRLGPVTPRTLTRQLRELEADGIVTRTVFAEVPPRVEYALTELGESLASIVDQLDRWGADYAERAGLPG